MSDWREDIVAVVRTFTGSPQVQAAYPVRREDLVVELHPAPHQQPTHLPAGKQAVYAFWGDGEWLKIGIAGPKSAARYTSQHYNPLSAPSTLAGSLLRDPHMRTVEAFALLGPKGWILQHCHRANILLPAEVDRPAVQFLESFMHAALKPRYEGATA